MRIFFILLFLCTSANTFSQERLTTFILIRHAEKVADGTKDPDLSEEGKKRALALVEIFKNNHIDAIFSTPFHRTESTVRPLAQARSLNILHYDPFKMQFLDSVLTHGAGQTVVICGHSNTIPAVANFLTATSDYKDFADTDYGNILVVTVAGRKEAKVTWLRF